MDNDTPLFNIYQFICQNSQDLPGYFVVSTAPINVEDRRSDLPKPDGQIFKNVSDQTASEAEAMIKQIAEYLLGSQSSEIVIAVHGYNSHFSNVENWYKQIYQYINTDKNCQSLKRTIFLGYRWPSEDLRGDEQGSFVRKLQEIFKKFQTAFIALPLLPVGIFSFGLLVSILSSLALLIPHPYQFAVSLSFITLLLVGGILSTIILALIILRLVVYFRDSYRAVNFGVPDLVELVRQLQKAVHTSNRKEKIKLSFIGHSMGCFVITNAIRILSDVFDQGSIGTLGSFDTEKAPSKLIGDVFSLERLVLVAPDIPVETIVPRRANFLRASLRRFEEAYIFSNEGDLALRLASTAANYFSFPAKTRISGYRLGNITVKHFNSQSDKSGQRPSYGIVNLNKQQDNIENPYECLEIRSSNREHQELEEIRQLSQQPPQKPQNPFVNRFTFFDCTDYIDEQIDKKGCFAIVSDAKRQASLNFWDYVTLTISFATGVKDTHGGYFKGKFTQRAIYQLAFLGFENFLLSFQSKEQGDGEEFDQHPSREIKENLLEIFSRTCKEKGIQVVLAPERYRAIMEGQPIDRSGY